MVFHPLDTGSKVTSPAVTGPFISVDYRKERWGARRAAGWTLTWQGPLMRCRFRIALRVDCVQFRLEKKTPSGDDETTHLA